MKIEKAIPPFVEWPFFSVGELFKALLICAACYAESVRTGLPFAVGGEEDGLCDSDFRSRSRNAGSDVLPVFIRALRAWVEVEGVAHAIF